MKTGKSKKSGKKSGKKTATDRKARLAAAKGDGTFPDRIIVTKERETVAEGKVRSRFEVHKEELDTLHKDGQQVAVYKLVRVSSLIVKRKIALNRNA